MSIEFRNVSAGPLKEFTASAPNAAIIGVVGGKNSGVTELLKLAAGAAQPESGEITAPSERRLVALGDSLNLAPVAVLALDQALRDLAKIEPRQATLVESRFFGGLDVAETAELLDISESTVLRDWRAAKAWLAHELR